MIDVRWAGEDWVALGERGLWWPRRRTLCVADLHLGKAAAFRHGGVPVPESMTGSDLQRLSGLVRRLEPGRLVILGDLVHAREGFSPVVVESFAAWREEHRALEVLLVRGNHDVNAGDPPRDWRLRVHDAPHADDGDGEVRFCHDPDEAQGGAALCGHLHPAVALEGASRSVRAACFWWRDRVAVLPAFGSFTGSRVVYPSRGDRVLVVRNGEIADPSAEPAGRG